MSVHQLFRLTSQHRAIRITLKLTSLPGLFSLIDRFDLPHKSSIRLCLRTRLSPSHSPSDNIPNSPMFTTATADDGRESCEYELAYVMVMSRFAW